MDLQRVVSELSADAKGADDADANAEQPCAAGPSVLLGGAMGGDDQGFAVVIAVVVAVLGRGSAVCTASYS